MELLFHLLNLSVLPVWALMIFRPGWSGTRRLLRSPLVLVPWALFYSVLVIPHLPDVWPALLRPTLPDIARILGRPEAALVAWAHFLAFDLFVGRWICLDSAEQGLSPWATGPILALTLLLGPLGLLAYLTVRSWWRRRPERSLPGADRK